MQLWKLCRTKRLWKVFVFPQLLGPRWVCPMGILVITVHAPCKLHYQADMYYLWRDLYVEENILLEKKQVVSQRINIWAACQKPCCAMILTIPASLCGVQELTQNTFKICLKRQRRRQNSSSKYLPFGTVRTHPPTKRAGAAWLTLVWKHSREVGGWHHSALGVGPCPSMYIGGTYTCVYIYIHLYTHTHTHSSSSSTASQSHQPPPLHVHTNAPWTFPHQK